MKKLITLLFASLLTCSLSAQEYGVKGGIALASVYGSDADDIDDKTIMNPGIMIGGIAQFGDDDIRKTIELLYIQKGARAADDGDYFRLVHNYLDVNFMGNYFTSDAVSLNAGVYLGYFMSGKAVSKFDGDKDTDSYNDDDMDDFNRIDLGSNFGVTFFLDDAISIDVRYSLGILKLDEDGDTDLFNNSIQLSVGKMF